MRPFRQIFEVECDTIRLCEVVKITRIKLEEVHGRHGPHGRHFGGSGSLVFAAVDDTDDSQVGFLAVRNAATSSDCSDPRSVNSPFFIGQHPIVPFPLYIIRRVTNVAVG